MQSSASSPSPGFKLLLVFWTLCSTGTLSFGAPDVTNGQGTPSPGDSWHELQDHVNEPQHLDEPPYYTDLGHYFWDWVKDLEVIPDDYETFNKHLQHYNNIDVNGDGRLDGLELLQYMHHNDMVHRTHSHEHETHDNHFKLTHYEKDSSFIDSLLSDTDADRDGFLDFYEYSAAAKKYDHSKHPVMKQVRREDHLL